MIVMTEMGVRSHSGRLIAHEECAYGQDDCVCGNVPALQGGSVDECQIRMNAASVSHISPVLRFPYVMR